MIIVSCGDPHGIGPEILLKGIHKGVFSKCLVVASKKVIEYYRGDGGACVQYFCLDDERMLDEAFIRRIRDCFDSEVLNIVSVPYDRVVRPGVVDEYAAWMSLVYIRIAVELIRLGVGDLLVTGPVNKEAILMIEKAFVGHTEYLAKLCDVSEVTMFMVSERIKVALATTHVPLGAVSGRLNIELIVGRLVQVCDSLKKSFHVCLPRIAVAALNPHAGEGGLLGNEDRDIVRVAVEKARSFGIDVCGPFAADTLFAGFAEGLYDAYVALYHDQGLIPFKLLSFGRGLNVTLGLPFLRFSVDHGTAYDIAGKNCARSSHLTYVMESALEYLGNGFT